MQRTLWRTAVFMMTLAAPTMQVLGASSFSLSSSDSFQITMGGSSAIATSLSDLTEGRRIAREIQGRYACHSLMGPKCSLTNGESDESLPAALLGEMLRQVLASTVKARAGGTGTAATGSSDTASATGSDDDPHSAFAAAAAASASAAAQPIASTPGLYAHDDDGGDDGGVGGVALYDEETGELLETTDGEEMFIVEIDGERRVFTAKELHEFLAHTNAAAQAQGEDELQLQFMSEEEETEEQAQQEEEENKGN